MIKKLLNEQITTLIADLKSNLNHETYSEFKKDYADLLAALNKLYGQDFEPHDAGGELDIIYNMTIKLDDDIADKKYDEDGGNELYYFAVDLHIFDYLINQYEGE